MDPQSLSLDWVFSHVMLAQPRTMRELEGTAWGIGIGHIFILTKPAGAWQNTPYKDSVRGLWALPLDTLPLGTYLPS